MLSYVHPVLLPFGAKSRPWTSPGKHTRADPAVTVHGWAGPEGMRAREMSSPTLICRVVAWVRQRSPPPPLPPSAAGKKAGPGVMRMGELVLPGQHTRDVTGELALRAWEQEDWSHPLLQRPWARQTSGSWQWTLVSEYGRTERLAVWLDGPHGRFLSFGGGGGGCFICFVWFLVFFF